ncbi:hypothetical protein ACSTK8_24335 [Vibrio parahaemolyticus]
MSIQNWLRNQLTKVKSEEQAWSDFTSILGNALEIYVEPYLERIKRRVSLFEQSKEDLQIELKELGDFFSFGDINDENLAITILQRKDQIHFKRTLSPLISTLNREFEGLGVTWQALYNPVGGEYGIGMRTRQGITGNEDKYWLTSRGIIQIPLNDILKTGSDNLNDTLDQLEKEIERVVYPLIPLRIVFDGVLYVMFYHIKERIETIEVDFSSVSEVLPQPEFIKYYRMDAHPIDHMPIDEMITFAIEDKPKAKESHAKSELPSPVLWGAYRMDAYPVDHQSLDSRVLKSFYERLSHDHDAAQIKVGGDLVYSYRMDVQPLDAYHMDYRPKLSDRETVTQNNEVYSELATPNPRSLYRMGSKPLDSEPMDRLPAQGGYVRSADIINSIPTKKERKESIRLTAMVVDGEPMLHLAESTETIRVLKDADIPNESFEVESREILPTQSLRKDSTTSLDSMTPDREFPS